MASKNSWHNTKFPGVRFREHETRKHGVQLDRYFTITYKYEGKTKSEAVGWASRGVKAQEAATVLGELKQNQNLGKFPQTLKQKRELATTIRDQEKLDKEKGKTFDEVWTQFYHPHAKSNKSKKSWIREESLFRLWISPILGNIPFAAVSPRDLEEIKQTMVEKKLSPRSIQYALATVRQIYNVAKNMDIFDGDNPVHKVRIPKMNNRRTRFLSEEEAKLLLDILANKSEQLFLISLLSLYCGLRAGEIRNLEWKDIDFANSMILIRESKNGQTRHAFMTKRVKKDLKSFKKQTPPQQSLLFSAQNGKKIYEISRVFNKVITELGLNKNIDDRRQKVVFHSLRHTFASWLVQRGTPLYTVAKLMGHSTLSMTERYAHLAPDNLQAAISVLED